MGYIDANGYVRVYAGNHPKASSKGEVYQHVVVAESALGKFLPGGAQIHHVDDDPSNNTPSNLVICPDKRYHKFLHSRARIVRAGGNPNTQRYCGRCRQVKPIAEFHRSTLAVDGSQSNCKTCMNERKYGVRGALSRGRRMKRAIRAR